MPTEKKDYLKRHCPRLGGTIVFKYCLSCEKDGEPCLKIFDCWWEEFDIVAYLSDQLSAEKVSRLRQRQPLPKITTLVDMIKQAQDRISTKE